MATNISIYDLNNYPDNPKTLTVDLKSVVPYGMGGDEKWVLSITTTATASGSASIQDTFVDYTKAGWSKSSGIPTGPFTIDGTSCNMRVAIDEPSGSAATIVLSVESPASGDDVAACIQRQLSGLTVIGGAKAGNLSYLNAKCYYQDGRFIIVSGSLGASFTGSNRSSVRVLPGLTNDAAVVLGFDIPIESEALAQQTIKETYVTSIVSSSTTVPVNSVSGFSIGDCVALKTALGSTYYRYLTNVGAPNLTVNVAVDVAENTLVQLLRVQDPAAQPASYCEDIDGAVRNAIDLLTNQINFA